MFCQDLNDHNFRGYDQCEKCVLLKSYSGLIALEAGGLFPKDQVTGVEGVGHKSVKNTGTER